MADAVGRHARRLSPAFLPAAVAIGAATLAMAAWWLAADALRGKPGLAAEIGVVRSELWLADGWSELPASPEAAEAAFTRAPELKGAIGQAYRVADDANRRIIEQEFRDANQSIPQ
ncbi:hypothetical protein [Bradyrhizobium sp. 2S1]|uniref:hypothetical protein n=1 Tax=Bradyrhizobium sp. 2S1 TaxID=1404429 RepID=UPI00140DA909|nr:hypothetical protein [Bradyrhizobium sp. 2S1]MCK7671309.1 hypothetical protein [Bradyrhizobium sp. 2S1]